VRGREWERKGEGIGEEGEKGGDGKGKEGREENGIGIFESRRL